MSSKNLPACYNSRVYFQPKGEEKTYIKHFGDGTNGERLAYTKNVEEAKLFRSHVGWMGPGHDFDCYHVLMNFLRTFFTMDNQYRGAVGNEHFDDKLDFTKFVTESLEGKPMLTFTLIKLER